MGPPPFGDGNLGALTWLTLAPTTFNGAHRLFGDGKQSVMVMNVEYLLGLQWGHRLSAMETSSL